MRKVIRENSRGVQLVQHATYWTIVKPISFGYGIAVYHVGQEKYVKKIWNKRFCNEVYQRDGRTIERHLKTVPELLV